MIILKTEDEIEQLRICNRIVARVLDELRQAIHPGITTKELNDRAEQLIITHDAIPAFKGYKGFPASLCASINEQIVHAIPNERKLKEGDIISLDLGAKLNGFYGDAAITVPVGDIGKKAKDLLKVAEESLYKGIKMAIVGNRYLIFLNPFRLGPKAMDSQW